jgi:type IV pilus assembly protein PilE
MSRPTQRPTQGFTLIEVMIVVAIIGILAAIVYPSYTEYVKRGRRSQAQTALLEASQYMQRYYAANGSYANNLSSAPHTLPTEWARVPRETGSPQTYAIAFAQDASHTNLVSDTGFSLKATPQGAMNGDKCGSFTIDQTGLKDIVDKPSTSSATVKDCWK